ncbi:MAG: biopolymer transporter ExbD [Bradymonadales bacterium]|jgi:biopolymer transport protein ExbD
MQFSQIERKNRKSPTLDVTPLVDVVFLLLIFLLLTMTFAAPIPEVKKEAIIDIELAQSSSASSESQSVALNVFLDAQGQLYIDDEQALPVQELKALLLDKSHDAQLIVNLKADRRASHGQVIEALDLIKSANIKNLNLVVEKSP